MRDYGSGSVSQRKDGTWTARIRIGTKEDGKPIVKAFYGHTQSEVKKKLRDFNKSAEANVPSTVRKQTVGMYMTEWLETNKINTLKPKSYDRLETTVKKQVLPHIGRMQLAMLQPADVQKMINSLKANGLSYSTIKKAYDAVNDCFRTAVIQGTVAKNPAVGVTLPAQKQFKRREIKFYTMDEVRALYTAARTEYKNGKRKYRLGEVVIFDINTGLRLGELLGLKWEDIDMDERLMTVRNNKVLVRDRTPDAKTSYITIEQDTTKTKSGERQMYLNDDAMESLRYLKKVAGNSEYVVSTTKGNGAHQKYMDDLIHNVEKSAGFPEEKCYGFHALRHTFASLLFASGEEVKTVSALLGHSTTEITYNTYIHLVHEQKKSALNRISDFMRSAT